MGGCNSLLGSTEVEPVPCTLVDFRMEDDLPQELLSLLAWLLLKTDLPALLRLSIASKVLHSKLAEQRQAAAARRVRWVKELNKCHAISNQDCTLTLVIGGEPWACGVLLPVEGCYSLSMRVGRGRDGNMTVGVCNAACDRAGGLDISTGNMVTNIKHRIL